MPRLDPQEVRRVERRGEPASALEFAVFGALAVGGVQTIEFVATVAGLSGGGGAVHPPRQEDDGAVGSRCVGRRVSGCVGHSDLELS